MCEYISELRTESGIQAGRLRRMASVILLRYQALISNEAGSLPANKGGNAGMTVLVLSGMGAVFVCCCLLQADFYQCAIAAKKCCCFYQVTDEAKS